MNENNFAEGYAIGRDTADDGMFGGNGMWWILIFLLFGYGGFGFGGGHINPATSADIQRGFDTSAVINKLDGITTGLCDGFYAVNTGMLNGFAGVNSAISNLGYEMERCCCETNRSIDGVRYDLATSTCDIKNAIHNETARILDYLTTEKISSLQLENQALKFQASQSAQNALLIANSDAQTAELIRRLGRDVPVPSYLVPNPNCCYTATNACGCAI